MSSSPPLTRIGLVALVFAAAWNVAIWQSGTMSPGLAMDEGMTLLYPELVGDGRVPQRDFETFYPPGNIWLLSGVYAVFGAHIETARAVGCLYQMLILAGIAVLVRPAGWAAIAAAWTLSGAMFSLVGLTPFAWFLALACLVWAAVAVSRETFAAPRNAWPVLAGSLAGFALLARHDVGIAAVALLGFGWLRAPSAGRAWMVAAFAAALVPLGWHVARAGWEPVWTNLVTMPLGATRPERRLPLPDAKLPDQWASVAVLLALATVLVTLVFALIRMRGTARMTASAGLLAGGLCSVGVIHQMFQMVDYPHVVMAGVLPVALAAACPAWAMRSDPGKAARWAAGILATMALIALGASGYLGRAATAAAGTFTDTPSGLPVIAGDRRFYVRYPEQAAAAQGIVDFLLAHARAGERLICGPSDLAFAPSTDTFFYHLLYPTLVPGTYFLEFNPRSANRPGTRLAEDVREADWIIQNYYYEFAAERDRDVRRGDPRAQAYVDAHFERVATFGAYRLLHRKDREPQPAPNP